MLFTKLFCDNNLVNNITAEKSFIIIKVVKSLILSNSIVNVLFFE